MSIPGRLAGAVGSWDGRYRLWLSPTDPPSESTTSASISAEGAGRFLAVRYDWTYDDKPQEGLIVLGDDPQTARCEASWLDSFHNSDRLVPCSGPLAGGGAISVLASYAAPPGPDWGWRTELEHPDPESFTIRMFNVTPDGVEALAVEANYRRRH